VSKRRTLGDALTATQKAFLNPPADRTVGRPTKPRNEKEKKPMNKPALQETPIDETPIQSPEVARRFRW